MQKYKIKFNIHNIKVTYVSTKIDYKNLIFNFKKKFRGFEDVDFIPLTEDEEVGLFSIINGLKHIGYLQITPQS